MDGSLFFQAFYAAVQGLTGSQYWKDFFQKQFSASGELDTFGEPVKKGGLGVFL